MNSVYIIAEAGVNHNGSLELAKQLIDVAAEAGVDAVKFQTFKAASLLSKNTEKAEYQKRSTGVSESQYDMIKKLELDENSHYLLLDYCMEKGVEFLSTPFDLGSIEFLVSLGMKRFKIASGEITNLPYLKAVGRQSKEVILSTGMSTLAEVEAALNVLLDAGTPRDNIIILHANTEYPTPVEDVNLLAMNTMQEAFGVRVGYSDHTLGIEAPIAATALGACVIEKHFTLDRGMDGPDHKASLEPRELKEMVIAIRHISAALGDGEKKPSASERPNIAIARKSIIASSAIKRGDTLTEDNLTVKRPGTGISPMRWDEIIGTQAQKDYKIDELI